MIQGDARGAHNLRGCLVQGDATVSMSQEAMADLSWQVVAIPERYGQWVADAGVSGIRSRTLKLTLEDAELKRSLAHSCGPTCIES